jgi:putative transcriptional regulator
VESKLDMPTEINNRVKALRTARGWTQKQLADAVGVSRQSINSIERERYVPSLPLALTFARVFGCSTDEIFSLPKSFSLNISPNGSPGHHSGKARENDQR